MNSWPLIVSSLLMGATGSLHCIAMCSGLQQTAIRGRIIPIQPDGGGRGKDGWFQAGRIAGYSLLGVLAGLTGEWLLSAAALQPAFRSVWAALNALLLSVGLTMLLWGRQPLWLARLGLPAWWKQQLPGSPFPATPGGSNLAAGPAMAARGMLWALLPCGLLYSALALAILAGEPVGAGLVMTAFGIGTAGGLLFFQGTLRSLLARFCDSSGTGAAGGADAASLRISGLLLTAMAGVALVAALTGHGNPFCS